MGYSIKTVMNTMIFLVIYASISVFKMHSQLHTLPSRLNIETKEPESALKSFQEIKSHTHFEKNATSASSFLPTLPVYHGPFPQGCNWQCYLRNHEDLEQNLPWNEKAASSHYRDLGIKEKRGCKCPKILLLAGPHKAASTTLQTLGLQYDTILGPDFPWHFVNPMYEGMKEKDQKSFMNFVFSYYDMYKENNFRMVKMIYKDDIEMHYSKGNNIIMGIEEIDRISQPVIHETSILSEVNTDDKLLDEILSVVPASAIQAGAVNVVTVYRAPRISHLKSQFKELLYGMLEEDLRSHGIIGKTFYEFLLSLALKASFYTMDTLELTKRFLEKGLKVKLIDMSGVDPEEGIEFFNVLGCDLMELECNRPTPNSKQLMPLLISESPHYANIMELFNMQHNKREDTFNWNITEVQKDQVEALLQQYDCSKMHILQNSNLEIMYGKALLTNMEKCHSYENQISTRSELFTAFEDLLLSP
jgi:hypothetical protein